MRNAVVIAAKDLKRSLRDRSAIAVGIVGPFLLALILSTVLPDERFRVRYGVVETAAGSIPGVFVREVLGGRSGPFATVRDMSSRTEAARAVRAGRLDAAFVFPRGFSADARAGRSSELEVIGGSSEIGSPLATALAQGFAADLDAVRLSVATALSLEDGPQEPGFLRRARRQSIDMGSSASLEEIRAGDKEFDDKTFFAAGMAVFFLFFTTQFGAVSLLRERREGTLTRLMAAPQRPGAIVAGKALFTFALGAGSLTVLILASTYLLGSRWGDPLGVALVVVAAVFAATGVQSLVATLAQNDEQAAGYGSIIAVSLGLLGGTFFPLSQAPSFLSKLSYLTPHAWIMRALGDLSGGGGSLADIVPSLLALGSFGAATGSIALIRARSIVTR